MQGKRVRAGRHAAGAEPPAESRGGGSSARRVRRAVDGLFAESPFGIAVLDAGGGVLAGNPALAEVLGRDLDQLIGRPLTAAFAREDRDDVQARLAQLVMGTTPRVTVDSVRVATGGGGDPGERAVAVFATPVVEEGAIVAMRVHILDATEQRALEARFVHAQRLQALGQFAGGIAHDFNNLIGGVLGFSELLLGRLPAADPAHEELSQIRGFALRARELARQLLAFARKQPLRPVRLQVDAAIEALLPMLRGLVGPQIPVTLHTAPHSEGRLPRVRIDASRFDQVIVNLAVNARDAMPDGGRLMLRLDRIRISALRYCRGEPMPAGSYVMIEVADTGCGISREVIGQIFEPFYTTKPDGSGSGLGLATVWGIVRQSGGVIDVDSAVGRGASFRIYLPADLPAAERHGDTLGDRPDDERDDRPDDSPDDASVAHCREVPRNAAAAAAAAIAPDGAVSGDRRPEQAARVVLLVDDEEPIRRIAGRALRARGFRVLEAEDGDVAIDLLARQPELDLLIADLGLPGTDGRSVVADALRQFPRARALIISGHLPELSWPSGGEAARVRTLPKPFTLAELDAAVDDAVAG